MAGPIYRRDGFHGVPRGVTLGRKRSHAGITRKKLHYIGVRCSTQSLSLHEAPVQSVGPQLMYEQLRSITPVGVTDESQRLSTVPSAALPWVRERYQLPLLRS